MDARIHEVGKLFQGQLRLVIPIYQRPYVWNQERQWGPLWSDIKRLAENVAAGTPPKPHFLGAVVVDADPRPIGYLTRHLVVDGQQRLTTIQLFLEAMADNYERVCDEGCTAASIYADRARSLTRNQFVGDDDRDAQFKVWPMNIDQSCFRAVMSAGSPEHLRELAAVDSSLDGRRIRQAYEFFYLRIREWLASQPDLATAVGALYDVVDRYLQIVVIDLQNSVDPQLIFETLNARGTPLLPSDLIKNFLFHQVATETGDGADIYAEYWVPFEEEHLYWSETIGKGATRRARLDTFMHQYLTMKARDDIQVGKLYLEYRYFAEDTDMTVTEQLSELRRYGKVYRSLDRLAKDSREATFMYRLRLMDTTTIMPFVLQLMGDPTVTPEDRSEIMTILESYLVRRMVCHLTGKAYNRKFVDLLRATDEGGLKPSVVRDLLMSWDEDTTVWPDDDAFRSAWMSYGAYNWMAQARVRMILEALEPVVRSSKAEDIDFNEALTIEHLMPQQWRTHYPLPADGSADEISRDHILHTFGNLTLLTKKLNPSVSNGRWSTDPDLKLDKGKRAEILRHSSLGLNSMLIDYETWDEKAITNRGKELFEAALATWPRPASESSSSSTIQVLLEPEEVQDIPTSDDVLEEAIDFENDTVQLVPAQGDAHGHDKTDSEKLLVFCPAVASDTLLLYIREGDSYSLRSYGGRLGINANQRHALSAHTAHEFEGTYKPDHWRPVDHLEIAVTNTARWEQFIAEQWSKYQAARLDG